MEDGESFRYDSDSGSELSVDSEDSWISYRNEDLVDSDESSVEMESDSDARGDRGMEFTDQGAVRGYGMTTQARRGRGTRNRFNVDQFEWDFYPDIDPFQQDWLKEFEEDEGVSVDVLDLSAGEHPVEYFKLFFPDELTEAIVTETNRYAHQVLDAGGDTYRRKKWVDTYEDEIKAFMGLQICMGLYPQCSIANHWSSTFIYENKFAETMGRNRYQYISSFLHFSNNNERIPRGEEGYDPLFKVQPLLDATQDLYKLIYTPGKSISIDETMIAFKGRHHCKQYLPDKPHKWGFKLFTAVDPKCNYCFGYSFYTGKAHYDLEGDGMGEVVVKKLVQDYIGKGHVIFTDSFYTSPKLFQHLAQQQTGACGTCVDNRIGFPAMLKKKNLKLKKHDDPQFARSGNLIACTWHDTKRVNFLSTVDTNNTLDKRVRSRHHEGGFREIEKPVIAESYNSSMGGVDHFNQKLVSYLYPYRCRKWYHPIYHFIREVALVNSYVIYTKCTTNPLTPRQFRLLVAEELTKPLREMKTLQKANKEREKRARQLTTEVRLSAAAFDHFPMQYKSSKPRCIVCTGAGEKRVQTSFFCSGCNVPLCVIPCFRLFHTINDYAAARKAITTPKKGLKKARQGTGQQ